MKLVLTLAPGTDAEVLGAQLGFHLNAGVDLILASDTGLKDDAAEALNAHMHTGHVQAVPAGTDPVRLAVVEHGADWVIDSGPGEFWWPRGEGLKDVLVAIPPRYTIVQALVRVLLPRPGESGSFADRTTVRRPVEPAAGGSLRPLFRARPTLAKDANDAGQVPLRAWYPIEVFQPSPAGTREIDEGELANGVADGSFLVDERLRDALRELSARNEISFTTPDVVDDAAYAVECAAVGEVDLQRLDQHIRALEGRIAFLEARLWPRVLRSLSRLGGAARVRR